MCRYYREGVKKAMTKKAMTKKANLLSHINSDAKYKSIDLFAGIGGIRPGFDKAFKKDIQTVFVSEWDKYAQETYKTNFNDGLTIYGDITKINVKSIPKFDISKKEIKQNENSSNL